MNIVYRLIFEDRLKDDNPPYYYIGSKSNCTVIGGVIVGKRGPYYGSSKYKGYRDIVNQSKISVEILYESDDYKEVLKQESYFQSLHNAVTSPEYFNLCLAATDVCFTYPGMTTYRHINDSNKIVRLPVDHPLVVSGDYVGVTRGSVMSDDDKRRRGRSGDNNGFYGRTHTDETKELIRSKRLGTTHSEDAKLKISIAGIGVKKSEEHKRKIGRRGMINLKCPITGDSVRVYKDSDECKQYIDAGYLNPYAVMMKTNPPNIICPYCGKNGTSAANMNRWHFDNCKFKGTK